MSDWSSLYQKIAYTFKDESLIKCALTHRSVGEGHNERLEFLGDAVLGFVIADQLYVQFPQAREGQMSRMRANLIRSSTLAALARGFGLGDYLNLGVSAAKNGSHTSDSLLEDAMEALIGAIYKDSDFATAQQFVQRCFAEHLQNLSLEDNFVDAKSRLQEYAQQLGYQLPRYEVIEIAGAEHQQSFTVRCSVPELGLSAEANGSSRKRGEQGAAAGVLSHLGLV